MVLPSVAKVSIAAFSNVLLPLWLCVVFTAYMFGPIPYWLSEGNTACVLKIRNRPWEPCSVEEEVFTLVRVLSCYLSG